VGGSEDRGQLRGRADLSSVSPDRRPSAHAQRYDRQLRLWASSGQRSLESAHLLCVGSTALAGQILKNLVLPGVGRVTVVDDAPVTEADLGNNFFLEEESLGRSRVREMTRFVCELNPDVEGQAREEVRDLWR
jgi:amyloid beta precursor protein binding protein 1